MNSGMKADKLKEIACIEMNTKKVGPEIKTQRAGLLIDKKFITSLILFYIRLRLSKRKISTKKTQIMKERLQIEDGASITEITRWMNNEMMMMRSMKIVRKYMKIKELMNKKKRHPGQLNQLPENLDFD